MVEDMTLNELIEESNAGRLTWTPGRTSMSNLPIEERRKRLGYVPGPDEPSLEEREKLASAAYAASAAQAGTAQASTAPASWDWRNVNGQSFISSVKDQGGCGSCVAFGTAAAIDALLRITTKDAVDSPGDELQDLSEAQLFYCGAEAHGVTCLTGWNPSPALAYCQSTGLVPEATYPYTARDQSCGSNSTFPTLVTTISGWQKIYDVPTMKNWISSNGPLIATFTVYTDFSHYTGGVYTPSQNATPTNEGHCMCVIGYDDSQQAWLCKNSWGTDFGNGGYMWFGYGQCGIDSYMWAANGIATGYDFDYSLVDKGTWEDTVAMTAIDDTVYAVQDNSLWSVDRSGDYQKLGTGSWGGTTAMAALGGSLYIVQGNTLYQVDTQGNYQSLGDDWGNTTAMTTANGLLYIVQGGSLYQADTSGTPTLLGNEGEWPYTTAMTSLNNVLYIVQSSTLYKAELDGTYTALGTNGVWEKTTSMTTLNGFLYISQDGVLWVADPADGSYAKVGDGWEAPAMTTMENSLYIVADDELWNAWPSNAS